ncbi:MAG: cation diffusion facilitator family transporter [Methyloceanibacter sp.]|nr:cation diffusion facilitator family transporter [Methyloceanibacter sp.]
MHGSNDHALSASKNETRMGLAALLTGAFMLVELAGGIVANSLALIADAGHMLTDFAALGLAWFAFRLMRHPADWKRTYGFDRFQVLVAFTNGLALFVIAAWIVYEAIHRLIDGDAHVAGGIMVAIGLAGLVVNIVAFLLLRGADRENLNVRGAALHVLGDLLGSVAALIAGGVIMATGWTPIDPLLSVLVAMIILRSGWFVVVESAHILLESAPSEFDTRRIAPDLVSNIEGVDEVHHVHVWSLTQARRVATLHAVVKRAANIEEVIRNIKTRLNREFGLDHITVEVEYGRCADQIFPNYREPS